MRRLTLILMATAALAACGDTTPKPAAAPAAAAPAPVATYAVATAEAVARWSRVEPMGEPVPADDAGQDCQSLVGRQLAVRICSVDGRVASMVATSRPGSAPAALDQALAAMADLVAPDAEPADLTRIAASAADGLAGAGTMLCPTTRCLRITPTASGWILAANAGQG